eukprot:m.105349 g.105349  ORF g.105349 m.105349 type:complete len:67 (-) comp15706_c1_seq1:646-846(-)
MTYDFRPAAEYNDRLGLARLFEHLARRVVDGIPTPGVPRVVIDDYMTPARRAQARRLLQQAASKAK